MGSLPKLLIIGGTGLLGRGWAQHVANDYRVTVLVNKQQCDVDTADTVSANLADAAAVDDLLARLLPDLVINCAGKTNIEECETDEDDAFQTNVEIARTIAAACAEHSVSFVQISTDHLFDGSGSYVTEDKPANPVNAYGRSKAAAEAAVSEANPKALIIRTNFYGHGTDRRQSFSDLILNNVRAGKRIGLFEDVFFTPIYTGQLIEAVHKLVANGESGIFSVCGSKRISKYDFGMRLASAFDLDSSFIFKSRISSRTDLVRRPCDMSLSNAKVSSSLGYQVGDLDEGITMLKAHELSLRPQEAKKLIIPYGRQQISEDDIDRVNAALRSAWLTQGPMGPRFERSVAKAVDAAYGVATNSATSALHVACLSIGLGKGDLLWTSPNTFVASSNCGLYCGADVDFVDIDPQTYNMSAASLEAKLVAAQAQGRLPTVVVVVHYAGQSCEMEAIHALSQKYGFRIIEDASHAIGGRYQGNAVGSCQYSDMCVFSFHPVKIVTTGEGGMIVTNDPDLAERLVWHRSHGITNTPDRMQERPEGEIWNYQQIDCGYNYRLTDLQAALGLSQLDRLEEFVSTRHEIAARYDEALADLPIVLPHQHPESYSAYHLYPIRVSREMSRKSQKAAYRELLDRGIGVNLHYIPVYLQPFYADLGFERGHCPEAESYFKETLSIPMFAGLSLEDQEIVVHTLKEVLG